jgi:hypothetical protein
MPAQKVSGKVYSGKFLKLVAGEGRLSIEGLPALRARMDIVKSASNLRFRESGGAHWEAERKERA